MKHLFFNILLIATINITQSVTAQIKFEKHYGGAADDGAAYVIQTSDEGYLICGHTASYGAGGWDLYLIKTDNYGDTLWTKTCGGVGTEIGCVICMTADSGYAIVGSTSSFGNGKVDVYLIKINSVGEILWTKTYGGSYEDHGYNIHLCSDGGFALLGNTMSYTSGFSSIYLIRTNLDGEKLWEKTYEKLHFNGVNSFVGTADNGFLIAGNTEDLYSDESKIWLIKTDDNGDTLWTKIYEKQNYSLIGSSVELTDDNGYIIAGSIEDSLGDVNVYVLKVDEQGELIWSRNYPGDTEERASCIRKTNDNAYIISGIHGTLFKNSSQNNTNDFYEFDYRVFEQENDDKATIADVYLMKISEDGQLIWARTYGGSNKADWARAVEQTNDNGYIICGYTNSFTPYMDAYLIKTDANGYSNISNELTDNKVLLYPNPSDGEIHISLPENIDEMPVCQAYNILGELVYSNKFTSENLSLNIPYPGIYVIKIEGETVNISRKIIIY